GAAAARLGLRQLCAARRPGRSVYARARYRQRVSTSETVQLDVPTAAGHVLGAELFRPASDPSAAALIVPAMGVTQAYYAAFGRWLADQGFLVATFDYLGMGRSRAGRLRDVRATILDWARVDCAAMLEALAGRAPGKRLVWIGHSLGGQILPFVPN